jgi:polyhydroxyalkanoate synthase
VRVEDVRYGSALAALDPAALTAALGRAGMQVALRPDLVFRTAIELAGRHVEISRQALEVARAGQAKDGEASRDPRFADRAWHRNPFLNWLAESYLAVSRATLELVDSAGLDEESRRKARFSLELLLDAAAPTNVPFLNPQVVKEGVDTGGLSYVRGAANVVEDLATNRGLPRLVDRAGLEVGRALAATPGRVVFRNDLIELLAYEPRTERVHAEPLLYVPSWINKFYVLDLAPGRSFVEHAVEHGFTVFAISFRNPDESMAELTLDDYLRDGLLAALDEAARITAAPRVNLLGVCIGGTMVVALLAALAARGQRERVGTATLLNTLVDFAEPGEIGVFTDERTIERIERRMFSRGYLSGEEVGGPFVWMKGNDLVWRQVIANWYMGQQPAAFDVLAWNDDSTNLPAAMHSQFLRSCYLENRLAQPGGLVLDGTLLDVRHVTNELYVLASEDDHIAPWPSAFRTTRLVGGKARFVLTSGGHVVGMVNPPDGAKSSFRVGRQRAGDPAAWLETATSHPGSWWADWARWAARRSGPRVAPPELPEGEPAPGTYVHG